MTAARSRLMAKLDAAIVAAGNPIEAKCLRAERAGLLARQGQLEAAKAVIDELNAQLAWHPNTPLLAWLALAEGLHGYYSALGRAAPGTSSRPHVAQARALSACMRWRLAGNIASANDDMPRMATLRAGFDTALPERTARARAAWWPAMPAIAAEMRASLVRSLARTRSPRRRDPPVGLMHNQA
jgi:hypothetical protein